MASAQDGREGAKEFERIILGYKSPDFAQRTARFVSGDDARGDRGRVVLLCG